MERWQWEELDLVTKNRLERADWVGRALREQGGGRGGLKRRPRADRAGREMSGEVGRVSAAAGGH